MIHQVGIQLSSNIDTISYDDAAQTMDVLFKSGVKYRYFKVPVEVFTDFIESDRKEAVQTPGKFFASQVRNVFDFEKLMEKHNE